MNMNLVTPPCTFQTLCPLTLQQLKASHHLPDIHFLVKLYRVSETLHVAVFAGITTICIFQIQLQYIETLKAQYYKSNDNVYRAIL